MEAFLAKWAGELLVAGVLALFAWGFKAWSSNLKDAKDTVIRSVEGILQGQRELSKEFQEHRVLTERRVTRIETKVDMLHQDMEHIGKKDGEANTH